MIWITGHPGYRRLNRFADGELGPREQGRVAEHVAGCERCHRDVLFIYRAGDLARSLDAPPAPDQLLRGALDRRSAGERVLLPAADGGVAPTRFPWRSRPRSPGRRPSSPPGS